MKTVEKCLDLWYHQIYGILGANLGGTTDKIYRGIVRGILEGISVCIPGAIPARTTEIKIMQEFLEESLETFFGIFQW